MKRIQQRTRWKHIWEVNEQKQRRKKKFYALFTCHRHRQRQNYKWQQCNCNHTETINYNNKNKWKKNENKYLPFVDFIICMEYWSQSLNVPIAECSPVSSLRSFCVYIVILFVEVVPVLFFLNCCCLFLKYFLPKSETLLRCIDLFSNGVRAMICNCDVDSNPLKP